MRPLIFLVKSSGIVSSLVKQIKHRLLPHSGDSLHVAESPLSRYAGYASAAGDRDQRKGNSLSGRFQFQDSQKMMNI